MRIAVRVDASVQLGTGHVMRCLALANMLKGIADWIGFISQETEGNVLELIKAEGFAVLPLASAPIEQQQDAAAVVKLVSGLELDWLIVDHYQLDQQWENVLRPHTKRILVIDDLANRVHDCDILLDQNSYCGMGDQYQRLVPPQCQLLLGPQFLLLRQEFYDVKPKEISQFKRLLLFFGGSDPTNETSKALYALHNLSLTELEIDVVIGSSNPYKKEVERLARKLGAHYHCQIPYLASLMVKADVSLGAGGSAMWERCFVGLPTAVTVVAANQQASAEVAAKFGAIKLLGWHEAVSVTTYEAVIKELVQSQEQLGQLQQKGFQLLGRTIANAPKPHPLLNVMKENTDD